MKGWDEANFVASFKDIILSFCEFPIYIIH